MAYGGSQARGPIRAVAAGLHSNTGSELHHSSRQCWNLNPLSEARGQTRVLMVPSSLTAEPRWKPLTYDLVRKTHLTFPKDRRWPFEFLSFVWIGYDLLLSESTGSSLLVFPDHGPPPYPFPSACSIFIWVSTPAPPPCPISPFAPLLSHSFISPSEKGISLNLSWNSHVPFKTSIV